MATDNAAIEKTDVKTVSGAGLDPKKLSDKDRLEKGQILARVVLEIAGAPKEHVDNSIKLVVDHISGAKGLYVVSEETYEAEKKDDKDSLFSAFSEIELWFSDVNALLGFGFDYMPSSIEIIQPDNIKMQTYQVSGLLNELLARLHDVDMQLKVKNAENQLINKNAELIIRNFIVTLLNGKGMRIEELEKLVGIPKDNLAFFVKVLEDRKVIRSDSGVYSLVR
jgi:hypothetical protein